MSDDLKGDLKIDQANISEDIIRQPSLFGFYAEQHVEAERRLKGAKLELAVYEAALDKKIRDNSLSRNIKLTERQVETQLYANDLYIQKKKAVIEFEAQADQIKAIVDSLKHKKDMLITLASNMRSEFQSGMSFKAKSRAQTADDLYPPVEPEQEKTS